MFFLQVTAGERVEDSREENARGEGKMRPVHDACPKI